MAFDFSIKTYLQFLYVGYDYACLRHIHLDTHPCGGYENPLKCIEQ